MADLAALRAMARGRVQGVFFRAFVQERAEALKLTGYVRNRPDGAVEIMAEGERANLEKLAGYLKEGPPAAMVKNVIVDWEVYSGDFTGFSVRY